MLAAATAYVIYPGKSGAVQNRWDVSIGSSMFFHSAKKMQLVSLKKFWLDYICPTFFFKIAEMKLYFGCSYVEIDDVF
ncbi:MAG TPA: hypothetical protein VMH87_12825 [Pseudomonadales bacterium]|nr:hypothetical protein [Pseudomonadales bacterium]